MYVCMCVSRWPWLVDQVSQIWLRISFLLRHQLMRTPLSSSHFNSHDIEKVMRTWLSFSHFNSHDTKVVKVSWLNLWGKAGEQIRDEVCHEIPSKVPLAMGWTSQVSMLACIHWHALSVCRCSIAMQISILGMCPTIYRSLEDVSSVPLTGILLQSVMATWLVGRTQWAAFAQRSSWSKHWSLDVRDTWQIISWCVAYHLSARTWWKCVSKAAPWKRTEGKEKKRKEKTTLTR